MMREQKSKQTIKVVCIEKRQSWAGRQSNRIIYSGVVSLKDGIDKFDRLSFDSAVRCDITQAK
jgi:hypothetical protein